MYIAHCLLEYVFKNIKKITHQSKTSLCHGRQHQSKASLEAGEPWRRGNVLAPPLLRDGVWRVISRDGVDELEIGPQSILKKLSRLFK